MYHIKNDKRSQTSARLICEAMERLLDNKTADKISITELQKESTVSRATFYRLFDRTEDVVAYMYAMKVQEVYSKYNELDEEDRPSLLYYFIEKIMENWRLFESIYAAGDLSMLFRIHQEDMPEIFHLKIGEGGIRRDLYDYYSAMLTGIIIGGLIAWIQHDRKETAQEIYEMLLEQMGTLIMFLV